MFKPTILIGIAATLLLVGCSSTPTTTTSSEQASSVSSATSEYSTTSKPTQSATKEDVIQKIHDNSQVKSLHLELDFSIEDPSHSKKQTMKQFAQYNSDFALQALNLLIHTDHTALSTNKTTNQELKMIYTPEMVLWQQINNDPWTNQKAASHDLNVNPEYYQVVNQLKLVLPSLEFEETSTHYKFSYEGRDLDLIAVFKDTFSIELTGVKSAEFTKKLEVQYNKETYLLETMEFEFQHSRNGDSIELKTELKFDQYNKVDATKFEAPSGTNGA